MKAELLESFASWSNIIGDILRCIVDKIHSIQDRARMGVVCRSWHALLKDEKIDFPICLMLAAKENSDRRCFNIDAKKIILELDLPEIRERRCWGTPFGWLVTLGLDGEIRLFNPLSRASLSLPSMHTFNHIACYTPEYSRLYLIDKVLLSSSPTSPDAIIMIIWGFGMYADKTLAFAKPDDQEWTQIFCDYALADVICFNGNFFAACVEGRLFICEDLNRPSPKIVEFAPPPTIHRGHKKYIVDLSGDLCMITRDVHRYELSYDNGRVEDANLTEGFEVFKLDLHTKNWEKILSLNGHSVFLGNCCTFSVLPTDHPSCKSNCIYFTDDDNRFYPEASASDIGIYNCNNKAVEYIEDDDDEVPDLRSPFSPPLWIKLCLH
ncbi:Uncharacterized protein TCM_011972 [Theobroma cacao]|uniref:KIB1-4 beta-propeller domain-containing protein n=1 Tax=Theobroma cacao TaxID=3641 RepID=A0A061G0L9_THECC|nr:Uncharacterized protein TCM_011972 [Theobroma cacao]